MSMDSQRWAQRQYGWGIAFVIALAVLMLWWLFFQPPAWLTQGTGTTAPSDSIYGQPNGPGWTDGPSGPSGPGAPASAAVAAARATLDAAKYNPVGSMTDVRAAAQTVVAATAMPESAATPQPGPGPTDGVAQEPTTSANWWQTLLSNLPGLTALTTFIGLVVTSLMKWRTDLHETGHRRRQLELQQHELALERHQYELDRMRSAFDLERQKLDVELARKKLELRALEDRAAALDRRISAAE